MTSIVAPLQLGELGPTRGEEHHAARSFHQAIRRDFLPLLTIVVVTLFLRLPMIGGPPFSNERFYAFNAEMVW
jgi:hypothetical protein